MQRRSPWIETSSAERAIAVQLADYVEASAEDVAEQQAMMEELAKSVTAATRVDRSGSPRRDPSRAVPELLNVTTERSFAVRDSDLSTNTFAALAHELRRRREGSLADVGAVATPSVLASDMVALAASFWLKDRIDDGSIDWTDAFLRPASVPETYPVIVEGAGLLRDAIWYDPCVGGGVFPLAALELLHRHGLLEDASALDRFLCRDVCALTVTAARIRIAMSVASKTQAEYEEAFARTAGRVRLEDSLERYAEQKPMSHLWEGDRDEPLVDLVVGNPPYVRAERLPRSMKAELAQLYPSVSGGQVDLSSYFIVHGIHALRPGGVLCYVSSASFHKSRYGARIRSGIARTAAVLCVLDFDELPVFEEASIHTSVFVLGRQQQPDEVTTFVFDRLPSASPLFEAVTNSSRVPVSSVGGHGWNVGEPNKRAVLDVLESETLGLSQYVGEIYSGLKTGSKTAFILNAEQAAAMQKDGESAQYVHRMLRPASIRRWRAGWDGTHLIVIPKGDVLPNKSLVLEHVARYEESLRGRVDTRDHSTWYGLRECSYYSLFDRPKIVFPDIASEARFAVDEEGYMLPDGAFFLPSGDDFLTAILNSCVGGYFFRVSCNSIGNPRAGGRLRFKKAFVGAFPVPIKAPVRVIEELRHLGRGMRDNPKDPESAARINELALVAYRVPSILESAILGDGSA